MLEPTGLFLVPTYCTTYSAVVRVSAAEEEGHSVLICSIYYYYISLSRAQMREYGIAEGHRDERGWHGAAPLFAADRPTSRGSYVGLLLLWFSTHGKVYGRRLLREVGDGAQERGTGGGGIGD